MRLKTRTGVICLLLTVASVQCESIQGVQSYIYNPSNNYSRGFTLMYEAQPWNVAREMCAQNESKLAVPRTEEEFHLLQQLVRGMRYPDIPDVQYKQLVWLGISNLENFKVWKTVDGENIEDTGYHIWAGDNGQISSDNPAEPHCVAMDGVNDGLRDFWCDRRQPYICEKYVN